MTGRSARELPAPRSEGRARAPRRRGLAWRPREIQLGLVALLLGLAAVGWLVADVRMRGMDMGPATDLGSPGFYVSAWVAMMAGMMFPSAAPMVVVFARVQRARRETESRRAAATAVFVAGYLLAWTAFGLAAYGLLELLRSLSIDAFSWDAGGPYLAGGVILAGAVYQLTPLKDVCLSKCRNPLAFVTGHWRRGVGGALRMGFEHGAYCVGCCWALMASLFALGVMSLGWMVFVAALIAAEKLLPWKRAAGGGIALLLLVLGLAVALAPERVPGLTLPDHMQMTARAE